MTPPGFRAWAVCWLLVRAPVYEQASYDEGGLTFLTGEDGEVHAASGQATSSYRSLAMVLSSVIVAAGGGSIFWRRRAERSVAGHGRHRSGAPSDHADVGV